MNGKNIVESILPLLEDDLVKNHSTKKMALKVQYILKTDLDGHVLVDLVMTAQKQMVKDTMDPMNALQEEFRLQGNGSLAWILKSYHVPSPGVLR